LDEYAKSSSTSCYGWCYICESDSLSQSLNGIVVVMVCWPLRKILAQQKLVTSLTSTPERHSWR
jgi:hypothetical protein